MIQYPRKGLFISRQTLLQSERHRKVPSVRFWGAVCSKRTSHGHFRAYLRPQGLDFGEQNSKSYSNNL